MTIGESISRLRKEKGLSQEALGYELGVTRQAVSKWENDSATPDVEKLLLMSKLFGVSPGEILGVEEDTESLTKEQEKVVENVLDKYISALNARYSDRRAEGGSSTADGNGEKSEGDKTARRSKKWPAVAAAAVFVVLVLWCVQTGSTIKNIQNGYDQLRNEMNYVNIDVSSITNRVEEILAAQSSLFASVSCEPKEGNLAENTVTFEVEAVPKEQTENTRVAFTAASGGEEHTAEGVRDGSVFHAELTVPLTDSIQVMAQITGDGESLYEQIKDVYGLYSETLPVFSCLAPTALWGEHLDKINSGSMVDRMEIRETDADTAGGLFGGAARISSVRFVLLLNGEKIRTYDSDITKNEDGLRTFAAEYTVDFTLSEGDVLDFCYEMTDSYGRVISGYSGSITAVNGMTDIIYENPEGYFMY